MRQSSGSRRPADLGEACVREAMAIIDQNGLEALSLREVARRLGVSHQAPYKHFPSRDHLVAELVRRAFADFAHHLDTNPPGGDPDRDLAAMGGAYLDYAHAHPLHYRLMFGTPLPNPADHPAMLQAARHAFSLLCDTLARRHTDATGQQVTVDDDRIRLDALFIWSAMHGLASIREAPALDTLDLPPELLQAATPHVLQRLGQALIPPHSLTHGPNPR